MARAYVAVDWLEDSSIGLSGGHINVPFIIEIDAAGDDPYTPWLAAAPFGSDIRSISGMPAAVARRFVGLVSVEYGFPRLLNEKTYRGVVTYGPTSDRTIGLWRRSVRFASETKPFTWSLPELDENGNFTEFGKPKKVGSRQYVGADDLPNSPYSVTVVDPATGNLKTQKLKRTGFIENSNLSVNDGITSIVYEILVPQLTSKTVRNLGALKWHTNQFPWLDYPQWSLIFANWEAHDEVLVLPGARPIAAWYSNVVMEILYRPINKSTNPHGWRAVVLQDFWEYQDKFSEPVIDNTNGDSRLAIGTFVQYQHVSFDSLFSLINAGNPAN